MSKIREYTVIGSEKNSPSTLVIALQDQTGRKPIDYLPGQFAAISFFSNHRPTPARCYSITSTPTTPGYLQFGIRVKSDFTKAAERNLVPGAKVIVEGPFGKFTYNTERDKSALLIAGGIGITPFISMVRYATHLQLNNDMLLLYSAHDQSDIPFLTDLEEITKTNYRVKVAMVISSGPVDRLRGFSVVQGHIDGKLLEQITSGVYGGRTYFVCGPTGFMSTISKTLLRAGVPTDRVLTEAFAQGDRSSKKLKHSLPLQVYSLTGLSLLLGGTTFLVSDVAATVANTPAADTTTQPGTQNIPNATGTGNNSRQQSVNKVINQLQTGKTKSGSGSSAASPPPSPAPSPSPTPAPSPNPKPGSNPVAPVLSFNAGSTSVTSGQSTTLSWSINGDASSPVTCNASGGWSGSKASSGSTSVSPASTTTYKLTCANKAGSSSQTVTVNVSPACVSTPSKPC